MKVTASLAEEVNVRQACSALAVPRASFYRWQDYEDDSCCEHRRPRSPLALSGKEETDVLEMLHAERFVDRAPHEIYNALLDEGNYLCSVRTMYRILEKNDEVRERRNQLSHPHYEVPEMLAERANEVWSWDITKLRGAGQVDLFLPVRDPRHLQPVCGRVDGRPPGTGVPGRETD